jgi:hypothetical protein
MDEAITTEQQQVIHKQMTIWKFPVPIEDQFTIDMPEGAGVLHFGCQGAQPTLWAAVDPEAAVKPVAFRLFGTGHPIAAPAHLRYIGTCFHGPFVWHLFEAPQP